MSNRITIYDNGTADTTTLLMMLAIKRYENLAIAKRTGDLILSHGEVMVYDIIPALEYLDELLPSPPLYPLYPAARCTARQMVNGIITMGQWQAGELEAAARPWIVSRELSIIDLVAYAYLGVGSRRIEAQQWFKLSTSRNGGDYATR